jgi:hypothetical protein
VRQNPTITNPVAWLYKESLPHFLFPYLNHYPRFASCNEFPRRNLARLYNLRNPTCGTDLLVDHLRLYIIQDMCAKVRLLCT